MELSYFFCLNSFLIHSRTCCRCGNVAAILELDENLNKQFRVFDAAPQVCTFKLAHAILNY